LNGIRFSFYFSILLVFLVSFPVLGSETTGWFSTSNTHKLFIDGIQVFDSSKGDSFELPSKLTEIQEIESYLYLAEYFSKQKNRQGIATILYQIRLKPQDYRLADALITTIWKKSINEEQAAQKSLDSYIRSETNPYYKSLGNNIYTSLFTEGEDEKKSPENVNCNSKFPYYSLCRVFRLQFYLDRTSGKGLEIGKHYVNIMRVVSPFYEESTLHSIPFLEEIDEELPPRLAFLGFANEAINFQRMILEAERAALGEYSENSLERLSFLQVIAGKWDDAEKNLNQLVEKSRNRKGFYKNKLYVKLGTISYLAGRYEDSLKYFLKLDFTDWSSLIVHPLWNEPLSIPEAKDIIALIIWKTKGMESAVSALRNIPNSDKVYEEEVWPRLRIAQIIMDSNPDLAVRITDEISYLAQSRGWKRLEYSSTILQGYNQILNQQFRKSTIEFTKSRGILSESDSAYSSDWLRFSGLVFAHSASGQKSPVTNFIKESLSILKTDPPNEDLLTIKHYKPTSYNLMGFMKVSLDYLAETSDYKTMMELLLSYNSITADLPGIYETGLFQIRAVHNRFKSLSGFQTHREVSFQDSTYAHSREAEVEYLDSIREDIADKYDTEVKNPFIVFLPWEKNLNLFMVDPSHPKNSQWKLVTISSMDPISSQSREEIDQFIASLKSPKTVQIYLNEEGLRTYEHLRKSYPEQAFSLFYRFSVEPNYNRPKSLTPVVWSSKAKSQYIIAADRNSFEGTKIFSEKNRLHIWDYKLTTRGERLLDMNWSNGDEPEMISMKKVIRRMDYRTIPSAMIVTSANLWDSRGSNQRRILDWCSFWLRSGTEVVYYKKSLDLQEAASFYKDRPIGVSWQSDSDVIVISRDLY
jgi:hypothetical protein